MPPRPARGLLAFQENLVKEFGSSRVPTSPPPLEFVSSGSLTLDYALRKWGWPRGRIVELWGPPDTGKSTVVICSMREQQKRFPDLAVAYVDMEGTFDYDWAEANGLDTSPGRFQHLYPDHSEDASDMARKCCMSGHFSFVGLDSIGGMESKKAFQDKKGDVKAAEDDIVGKNAQVITRMVKHLSSLARQSGTTVLLVNQPRAVINAMSMSDQPSGPRAMKHSTTTRVRMNKGSTLPVKIKIDGADEEVCRQVKATVDRSKQIALGRVAEFWINIQPTDEYGPLGINRADEYATLGIKLGVIKREKENSSWYQIPTCPKVNGEGAVKQLLRDRPELLDVIRPRILEAI
jgi:recombination protein RecA